MKNFILALFLLTALCAKAGASGVAELNFLGVKLTPATTELKTRLNVQSEKGVWVADVEKGSIGAEYGLKKDDIIIKIDNKDAGFDDLLKKAQEIKMASEVNITFIRQGKTMNARMLILPLGTTGVVVA